MLLALVPERGFVESVLPLLLIGLLEQVELGIELGQLLLKLLFVRFQLSALLAKLISVGVELVKDAEHCIRKGDSDVLVRQGEVASDWECALLIWD